MPDSAPPVPASGLWDLPIGRCFDQHAQAFPSNLAIRGEDAELSYGELNRLANSRAIELRSRGVGSNEPVAILLDQGAAFIAALLGVLKAGGCFVPLDPANPPGRNLQMLQESRARLLVTDSGHVRLAQTLAAGYCEVLDVDLVPAHPHADCNLEVSPDTLACILFTSGSTGKPKGVMHDHRSLVHNAVRHKEAFGISANDRQTLLYTCSVYGGIRDILNALLSGASLHTFNVKVRGVDGLAEWMRASRITLYCSVATVFRQLAATLNGRDEFPDLRLIKLGGEASHASDVELFRKHFSTGCRLHCGFGSTETGVVRHFFVDRDTRIDGQSVPLGFGIPDMDVALLDEQGRPVASGEIGEIVVRSQFISSGYWQRPDLNERSFDRDPVDPRVRIYHTGDLGVMRADGCLEHRGRKDGLVKIRGNRVEIAEVESALRGVAGVAHAAVVARRDQADEDYLAAYIVYGRTRLSIGHVRRELAEQLPEHMVPAVFVELDAMPQTPNGKIDKQALPVPEASRPRLEQGYIGPRNPMEARLATLWSHLLRIERVGVLDDFFELGGNSLVAVRLMSRIRADYGIALPLACLLESRTVAALAEVIARGHEPSSWSPLVPIRSQGSRTPLFCIHPGGGNVLGYEEFISHLHPDQPVYALQAYGVVQGQTPHTSIHQMALCYLQSIREIQPSGPYYLGGESFGGLVAHEIACQLVQGGERVAFLFVGDAWPKVIRPLRYLASCLTYPFTLTARDWSSLLRRKVLRRKAPVRLALKRYVYADELHRANSMAHRQAAREFTPRRFPGVLTLFRATEQDHASRRLQHYFGNAEMGWSRYAAAVDVHWMPDIHREMMHGPNAPGFARELQACIDRARAEEEGRDPHAGLSQGAAPIPTPQVELLDRASRSA